MIRQQTHENKRIDCWMKVSTEEKSEKRREKEEWRKNNEAPINKRERERGEKHG